MTHLSLSVGAQGLEGLGQGEPLLALLSVSLAAQGGQEHDEVETQGLVVLSLDNTNRDKTQDTNTQTHIHSKCTVNEVTLPSKARESNSKVP